MLYNDFNSDELRPRQNRCHRTAPPVSRSRCHGTRLAKPLPDGQKDAGDPRFLTNICLYVSILGAPFHPQTSIRWAWLTQDRNRSEIPRTHAVTLHGLRNSFDTNAFRSTLALRFQPTGNVFSAIWPPENNDRRLWMKPSVDARVDAPQPQRAAAHTTSRRTASYSSRHDGEAQITT
jgi:hypothetical protein